MSQIRPLRFLACSLRRIARPTPTTPREYALAQLKIASLQGTHA